MINDISKLKIGQRVHYTDPFTQKTDNGMVKSINQDSDDIQVFVVYNCGGDWDNYQNFTGVNTSVKDLTEGWYFASIKHLLDKLEGTDD